MEKDHLEILLEDMNKKFDLVLEGHSVLGKKIDDKADELNEKIELSYLQIKALNKKIDDKAQELHEKIEGNSSMIRKMDKKLTLWRRNCLKRLMPLQQTSQRTGPIRKSTG